MLCQHSREFCPWDTIIQDGSHPIRHKYVGKDVYLQDSISNNRINVSD